MNQRRERVAGSRPGLVETEHVAGAGNLRARLGPLAVDLHPATAALVLGLAAAAVAAAAPLAGPTAALVRLLGPLTATVAAAAFLLCLGLAVSPLGRVRLGGVAARPDHRWLAWAAMLLTAGAGTAFVLDAAALPVRLFTAALGGPVLDGDVRVDLAPLDGALGDPRDARRLALAATLHVYGPLVWSLHAGLGLALGLACYNRGLPLGLRALLFPLLGERSWGLAGDLLEGTAGAAALLALAAAIAAAAGAESAALGQFVGLDATAGPALALGLAMAAATALGAARGIVRGVRPLAMAALALAGVLMVLVILAGPAGRLIGGAVDSLTAYAGAVPDLALPFGGDAGFRDGVVAWQLALGLGWAPFMGLFLARISRGRTVREFLLAALGLPMLAAALWLGGFGAVAIDQIARVGVAAIAEAPAERAFFLMLQELPLSALTTAAALVLLFLALVTTANAAALSIDTLAAAGRVGTPAAQRAAWPVLAALAAVSLPAATGRGPLDAVAGAFGLLMLAPVLLALATLPAALMAEPRRH